VSAAEHLAALDRAWAEVSAALVASVVELGVRHAAVSAALAGPVLKTDNLALGALQEPVGGGQALLAAVEDLVRAQATTTASAVDAAATLRERTDNRVASGEWRVASGEWRAASGERRVASGDHSPLTTHLPPTQPRY